MQEIAIAKRGKTGTAKKEEQKAGAGTKVCEVEGK